MSSTPPAPRHRAARLHLALGSMLRKANPFARRAVSFLAPIVLTPIYIAAFVLLLGPGLKAEAWQSAQFCGPREEANPASQCSSFQTAIVDLRQLTPPQTATLKASFNALPANDKDFASRLFLESTEAGASTIGLSRLQARRAASLLRSHIDPQLDLLARNAQIDALLREVDAGRDPANVLASLKSNRDAMEALAAAFESAKPLSYHDNFTHARLFRFFSSSAADPIAWAIEQDEEGRAIMLLIGEIVFLGFTALFARDLLRNPTRHASKKLAAHRARLLSDWEKNRLAKALSASKPSDPAQRE